jgi:hypothetical protein
MAFPSPPSPELQPFTTQGPAYSDPLQTLAQMQEMRTRGMQQQVAGLGLQQARLKMNSQKALLDAFVKGKGDLDQTYQNAVQSGEVLPEDLTSFQTHKVKYEQDVAALDEKKRTMLGEDINNYLGTISGVKDQPALEAANAAAQKRGLFQSGKFAPLMQYDDTHLAAYTNSLLGLKTIVDRAKEQAGIAKTAAETEESKAKTTEIGQKTAIGERALAISEIRSAPVDPATGTPTPAAWDAIVKAHPSLRLPEQPTRQYIDQLAESTVNEKDIPEYRIKQAEANAIKAYASGNPKDLEAQVDAIIPPSSPMNASTKVLVRGAMARGDFKQIPIILKDAYDQQGRTQTALETAKATAPIKIEVGAATAGARAGAVADAAGLTEDDYSRAGEQYVRTGIMPAVGRDSVSRGRIVKAGNQWARDNGLSTSDVITMQAAYAGDRDSLKKFQSQRDQIVSFEQTAQKNLDLFLSLAAKIPDTGIPWLNKPLRELNQGLIGSENMAAVNAARQIANNEIAKVTSGGGLSGVLSDSARHEVERYNPANATFAQTKAVARILKADMANRHASMDATLSDIKARIGGAGAPAATGAPPAATAAPAAKGPAGTVPVRVNAQGTIRTVWLTPAEAARFTKDHPDIVVK